MTEAIGMMTGAYFVGRKELLAWVNELLSLNYKKVEELCSGAAYCQILDALAPGKVNLKRVNFKTNQEYQYVENFKVLQNAFKALGITKVVNVVVLTGGSYQENLEFVQWLKAYYDQHVPQNAPKYDAVGRRNGKAFPPGTVAGPTAAAAAVPSTPVAAPVTPDEVEAAPVARVAAVVAPPAANRRAAASAATASAADAKPLRAAPSVNTAAVKAPPSSSQSASEASRKLAELQVKLDRAEQERDFYFNKLRDVEIYCQTHPDPNNQTVKDVTAILYAVDE